MNIIVWLLVGGMIGWIASLFMRTDRGVGIIFNVTAGILVIVLFLIKLERDGALL